jgi:hypothetical protein
MIIAIDSSGKVALNEATDFKGFKVTAPNTDGAFLTKALAAAGRFDGSHAWIAQSWLIEQGQAHGAAWRDGLTRWRPTHNRKAGSRTAPSAHT